MSRKVVFYPKREKEREKGRERVQSAQSSESVSWTWRHESPCAMPIKKNVNDILLLIRMMEKKMKYSFVSFSFGNGIRV